MALNPCRVNQKLPHRSKDTMPLYTESCLLDGTVVVMVACPSLGDIISFLFRVVGAVIISSKLPIPRSGWYYL